MFLLILKIAKLLFFGDQKVKEKIHCKRGALEGHRRRKKQQRGAPRPPGGLGLEREVGMHGDPHAPLHCLSVHVPLY